MPCMARLPRFVPGGDGLLPGAEPFTLRGGPVGVLLVHGFTSTPYDVRACAASLAAAGYTVDAPLLPGHGTQPSDLARTRLSDWFRALRERADVLRAQCDQVFALGISLSGNFLLSLAPFTPFDGLILVGTPLRFRHERGYRAAYRLLRALGVEYQRKWYLDALAPEIRARRPTYGHFPLACAPDCLAAVEWSRRSLPLVRCPVLILQSTTDHAVDRRTIGEFSARLGSSDITIRWLPDRYHVPLIDHGATEAFALIHGFLAERSSPREPVPAPPPTPAAPLPQLAGSPA